MKDLSFVSNVNGLQVVAPADAYPSPQCGGTMCPDRPEPAGFACTPQLDPGEGPVIFSVVVEQLDETNVGALYNAPTWVIGGAPDGLPTGVTSFIFGTGEEGEALFVAYDDGASYGSITHTVYDSGGNSIVAGVSLVPDEEGTGWSYQNALTAPLVDGATYCVQITIINGGPA